MMVEEEPTSILRGKMLTCLDLSIVVSHDDGINVGPEINIVPDFFLCYNKN
jgi:hypothetical protein